MASKHSPFHSILSFHSTCVMNFITYEAAYSMYPAATFSARIATSMDRITDKELGALAKYERRGWTITTNVQWQPQSTKKLFHLDEPRWVLDKHCLRIPLKRLNIPPRKFTPGSVEMNFDPAICNSWTLSSETEVNTTTGNFFVSSLFKYRYIFADRVLLSTVSRFLKKQGELEFRRMHELGIDAEHVQESDQWHWWVVHDIRCV
ncbi:hypothetical protein CC2G_000352 [Coprinopsis cinerea AmutBmut pab1-1]|nr:hypothetical protein CC2G_000352 [Coprinopsis cinerea AmutBmut pab1-1]